MQNDKLKYLAAWGCFFVVLILYFITACPTVPPYRDAGELITAAHTLSVPHSPGYPLYMVLGKFTIMLGGTLGLNHAYSMNLFSGISGAFAVLFLFFVIYQLSKDIFASIFGALLAGFAYINWYLAVVAEMYSLSLMLVVMLLYFLIVKKYILFAFICGLTFANHLTSVFAVIPMAGFVLVTGEFKKISIKNAVIFFILGLSIYLYLPIRAAGDAFINWGDPSSIGRVLRVVSRAAYGHTLDLVSREVALKDVFLPHLIIFGRSILRDLTPYGVLLALGGIFGIFSLKRSKERYFRLMLLMIFILTGPYFLYLAGMPVNPHALAIVEVGYMAGVTIIAIFAALGLAYIVKKGAGIKYFALTLSACALIYNVMKTYPRVDMSNNYFASDYAINILRSVPEDALVIMRRDHTMFALWYKKDVDGVRKDVVVISKGLLSADWYREKLMLDHPEVKWKKDFVSDTDYIKWLCDKSRDVYLTAEAAGELEKEFFNRYSLKPFGLVLKVVPKDKKILPDEILAEIESKYIFNGDYRTSEYFDFFSRDFIHLYAQFYERIGMEYMKQGHLKEARNNFARSIELDAAFSRPYSNLAYSYFSAGDIKKAQSTYITAIALMEEKILQYTRGQFFMKDLAELYNNLGAAYEKSGDFNEALNNYNKSLKADPTFSQAYYNKGVLYWSRKEWDMVVDNFKLALKYDPDNNELKRFYEIAVRNLRQNK